MARFVPGDRVRVRDDSPRGHVRTPSYVRGKTGVIARIHGTFRNPQTLAYGGDGLPKQSLYAVSFAQNELWTDYPRPRDSLVVDIYENWLEPAEPSRRGKA